jgi:NADH dehydrogenase [ubiquinone] 1 alpha subcomplex assembly factor 7
VGGRGVALLVCVAAAEHEVVNALGRRIARLIETQGPLSVAQFMTIAAHDSSEGYYATRDPFGPRGDFVTAPEISQMFGELIGLWLIEVWREQDAPRNARLMELGPGRGTLMADALRAARLAPDFLDAVEIVLVESNSALKRVQQERLKDCGARITWTERYAEGDGPLFLIANEFFDALPVRQYVHTEKGWRERMVVSRGEDDLGFALSPSPVLIDSEREAPIGGVIETAPAALALVEEIGHAIARAGGAGLIIDYGYDRPGFGETLQAVGKHRFEDVLTDPGAIDVSAHVDFTALAAAARRGGAQVFGPIEQGALLKNLGIDVRAETLSLKNPDQAATIASAVARLVEPGQMGDLFKAMAILPPDTPPPPGF